MQHNIFRGGIHSTSLHSDQLSGVHSNIWKPRITQKLSAHCRSARNIAAGLLLLGTQAFGTTYYVSSSSGSDSNKGTSITTPWKTIKKVNTGRYKPGDSILFKAGDTWTGSNFSATLTPPNSGTSSARITIGSYGTGAAPLLNGANAFATGVSLSQNYITLTGLSLKNFTNEDVHICGSNDTVSYTAMGNAKLYAVYICQGTGNVLDHNTYTAAAGDTGPRAKVFYAQTATGTISYTNNTINLNNLSSSYAPIAMVINGGANGVIQYNVVKGGHISQAYSIKPFPTSPVCGGPATVGGLIADNYAENAIYSSTNGWDGETIEVEGCAAYPLTNITVARNVVLCGSSTLDAIGLYYGQNGAYFGNIMIGTCGGATSEDRFIHASSSSTGNVFYNNTFTGSTGSGQTGILLQSSGNKSENNIFDKLNIGIECASCGGATEDYNLFNSNVSTPIAGSHTSGGHSRTRIDPKFVTSPPAGPNDVKLLAGSPAINSGANLGSSYKLILNPMGIAVPFGTFDQSSGWVIGAFGYLAANGCTDL